MLSINWGRVCDKGLCFKTEPSAERPGQPVKTFINLRLCMCWNVWPQQNLKFFLTYPETYLKKYPGVCLFCWNFSEWQILWSLCSVDFHTLTLQLPIQTPHSVAPELQVFVSSLKISAKQAHPCVCAVTIDQYKKIKYFGTELTWRCSEWN